MLQNLPDRIAGRIALNESDCWIWTGSVNRGGYGTVTCRRGDGRSITRTAHRVVYELLAGDIPPGLDLDHICRVRSCVNPSHLEPVTRRENLLRGETLAAAEAARSECGSGHPYTLENTYTRSNGARRCRTCEAQRSHHRKAAQVSA